MCIKEFLGFTCGHCSVPVLRLCPLAAQHSVYPPCEWPAQHVIFVQEYCHPCSRVAWNQAILQQEEEHRARHRRRECPCGVIFDESERKQKEKQTILGEKNRKTNRKRTSGRQKNDPLTNELQQTGCESNCSIQSGRYVNPLAGEVKSKYDPQRVPNSQQDANMYFETGLNATVTPERYPLASMSGVENDELMKRTAQLSDTLDATMDKQPIAVSLPDWQHVYTQLHKQTPQVLRVTVEHCNQRIRRQSV